MRRSKRSRPIHVTTWIGAPAAWSVRTTVRDRDQSDPACAEPEGMRALPSPRRLAGIVGVLFALTMTTSAHAAEQPAPDPRLLNLGRSAISPNGDGFGDTLVVSFTLPTSSPAASVRVVDLTGAPVRLLGQFAPDERVRVTWNGTNDAGRVVRDGTYRIVVAPALPDAAVAMAAAPTSTADATVVSNPVRVDRRPPRVRLASSGIRVASRAARRIVVPVRTSERATVRYASRGVLGSSSGTAPGTGRRTGVPLAIRRHDALARALNSRGAGRVSLSLVVRDDAGNRTARRFGLRVLPPASERLTWPLHAAVTSGFGPRAGRLHAGIDMPVPSGTPIRAAGPGRVTLAGSHYGYGTTVVVDHPGRFDTLYAHNSRLLVRPGQHVRRGQVIAHSGNTGSSSGPHLHFEVHVGGRPVNPLPWLS